MQKQLLGRIWFIFGIAVACICSLNGQSAASYKQLGDEYFRAAKYQDAIIQYSEYQLLKPGDLDVLTRLGTSYFEQRDLAKSVEYFEYVLSSGARNAKPEALFYLAKSYQLLEKWPEAIKYYKIFLGVAPQKHQFRRQVVDDIKRCAYARELEPGQSFTLIQNIGKEINTPADEHGVVPSILRPNRIFFSSARAECAGGLRRADGIADDVSGKYTSDIFYADKQQNGNYTISHLPELINTARHERVLNFSENGKIMYFTRGFDLFSGDLMADTAGVKDEHREQQPIKSAPLITVQGDQDLFLANDTLCFFASRRAGGVGGLDLYYSILRDTAWIEPVHMGPEINSPYDDRSPFLSVDGNTIYFSSNRLESMGGLDVFSVEYDILKKSWQKAINLGAPLNSAADDTGFRVAQNGKFAWITSNRAGGEGGLDIYMAYFKKANVEGTQRTHPIFLKSSTHKEASVRSTNQLLYTQDQDVLSIQNKSNLKEIFEIATANQQGTIIITAHIDETSTPTLDAFVGIKRAQQVSQELVKLGLPEVRIKTRSCGSNYPAALNVLGTEANELSKKYNNRIEVELVNLTTKGYIVQNQLVQVPELMRSEGQVSYRNASEGITYRVFFLETNKMYSDDVLGMFPEVSIESRRINDDIQYRYFSGLFKEVKAAIGIRDDLKAQGFGGATIVPYLFGKEITREEAIVLRPLYPDLIKYLGLR
jgi:outer membrane protein OmpA-like peptidoglycan-associated protein